MYHAPFVAIQSIPALYNISLLFSISSERYIPDDDHLQRKGCLWYIHAEGQEIDTMKVECTLKNKKKYKRKKQS